MKRLLVLSLASVFVLGATGTCLAGPYVNGNLAASIGHDSDWSDLNGATAELTTEIGYGLSLAIGIDLPEYRFELELAYRVSDIDELAIPGSATRSVEGDVSSTALLANYYKDFKTNTAIAPFIGAGIGVAKVDLGIDNIIGVVENESGYDSVFAYQLALGAAYKMSETIMLELSYRYFATEEPDINDTEIEYATSNIMLGARINF